MIRIITQFIFFVSISYLSLAGANETDSCFLVVENEDVILQEGDCTKQHSPCCSFNPFLAAMGFDHGFLETPHSPTIEFDPQHHIASNDNWKHDQTPTTWMKVSCLWYSIEIAKHLGNDQFDRYIKLINYGNATVNWSTETPWVMSSLKISAQEQVSLLQKLNEGKLPLKANIPDKVREILFVQDLTDGWKLYGKTGFGYQRNEKAEKLDKGQGWFVGWITKNNRTIYFAKFIQDPIKMESYSSVRAKQFIIDHIVDIITKN